MTSEEMRQKAIDLFMKKFHWGQAILAVGQEKLNCVDETVIKAMGAFGGGIASTGRICGALLGGIAFISSLYSKGRVDEADDPRMWRLSYKLTKKFEELTQEFDGINCHNIARLDWKDREATKHFYENPDSRRQHCIRLVGDTAYALGEILEKEATGGKK